MSGESAGWPKLQKENAALSTLGRYVVVNNATHMSLVHNETYANEAADLIREVLEGPLRRPPRSGHLRMPAYNPDE